MRARLLVRYFLITCVALFITASCRIQISGDGQVAISRLDTPRNTRLESTDILMIGNSFTYYNDGIDNQLEGLAPSIRASSATQGGYRLEDHWNDDNTLQTIRQGNWGYIILQEQSQRPVYDPQQFRRFATELDQEIQRNGAETIFFMTWERPDSVSYGVTTENLANAYTAVAKELGATVAPAGLAFARSLAERPDLVLYSEDGHPTIYGTYLAACVLYGTIFEQSPVGNPYSDANISPDVAAYFQRIAAASLGY